MAPAATLVGATQPGLDDATLDAVRPEVRTLLEQSPGFAALPAAQQRDIAQTMVRVAAYMANPHGLAREEFANPQLRREPGPVEPAAQALAGVDDAKNKASAKVGVFAGADFKAGALQQGTQEFRNLVGAVDFPAFVGGLIQNVFQAIVTASMQQMEAYGKLLKAVAQTVDQFAQDNISQNNARDWLAEKYPDLLTIETGGGDFDEAAGPRLAVLGEDQDAALRRINEEQQLLKPVTDLSDPEQEARLVAAARLQMARMRQQMLSSMVLLGINRIVVTDGLINAKVMFDFRASDQAQRRARASLYDRQASSNKNVSGGGFAMPWGGAATVNVNEQSHVTTVQSSVDETSESKAELKAKLTGEVRVNFKSDYFPMEKLASPGMIASIQGNATPFDPNPPRPAAPATPAAPARAAA